MVRLLEKSEKENSRNLYETCFPEDGKKFTDYYYNLRMNDNDIVVSEENGKIISGLHLIPKTVTTGAEKTDIHYIYAVGTQEEYRRQGHVRDIFRFTMKKMYQNKEAFTFLIPSGDHNADIYRKFGFSYVMDRYGIKPETMRKRAAHSLLLRKAEPSDLIRLSIFSQKMAEERKDISLVKTIDYFRDMMKLIAVEDGRIDIYVDNKVIVGYRIWIDHEILEEVLSAPIQYLTQQDDVAKPYVMARLIHLEEGVRLFQTGEFMPTEIKISDPVIKENNGIFLLSADQGRLRLKKIKKEKSTAKNLIAVTVGELTAHIFGYCLIEGLPIINKSSRFFINDYV